MIISLDGKTAMVTGAASGIGRAISEALQSAGARVAIADVDFEGAQAAAEALGEGASAVCLDVSDVQMCRQAVAEVVRSHGQIDILVNNAGICPLLPVEDVDEAFFDRIVAVNLRGAFFLSQAAAKHMRGRETGRIINIGSVGGKTGGYADNAVYCLTKAAIFSMTKSFAKFLAPYGTANTIAPATTRTALTEGWNDTALLEELRATIPLGRLGVPEDIAGAAVFLASEHAGFITGATIDINGGMRMD
jgi:3-oxoacyl-[acyl-carrier protein] reductase